jgi:hypothetical protein
MAHKKFGYFVGALLFVLAGCSVLEPQARPPSPKPQAAGVNQALKPVQIVGVPPATQAPIDRYSAALCVDTRCVFTVRVSADCQISLDPQWMGISRRYKDVTLVWELKDSPGFEFATDAIVNKPRAEDTNNPFAALRQFRGNLVEVQFKNTPGHVSDYAINITRGGAVCGTLDPPVIPDA